MTLEELIAVAERGMVPKFLTNAYKRHPDPTNHMEDRLGLQALTLNAALAEAYAPDYSARTNLRLASGYVGDLLRVVQSAFDEIAAELQRVEAEERGGTTTT